MKLSSKHFFLILVLLTRVASAQSSQVATGTPAFGSFGGGPFDTVNLGNLNVHFAIPVVNKAGRGMSFSYNLAYDSSMWEPVTSNGTTSWTNVTDTNWGWTTSLPRVGHTSYKLLSWQQVGTCSSGVVHNIPVYKSTYGWVYYDGFGTGHWFPGVSWVQSGNPGAACTPYEYGPLTATASDNSGYTITVVNGLTVSSLIAVDGAQINPTAGAMTLQDSNGNEITSSTSSGTTTYTDTLGTTALTVSGSGTPASPTVFTYTAPSGANVSYKMIHTQYTVQTNFGVSGITEYGPLSNPLVSSIELPDGSNYVFTYEATPGISCTPKPGTTSCVTGRIASVTLPTGGEITYTYNGGANLIESDGSVANLTRTLTPGGGWQYSRVRQGSTLPGPGSQWINTVVDPNGNNTVINFVEDSNTTTPTYNLYETQRQVYQGSVSTNSCSSTVTNNCLVVTTVGCYNGNYANCSTAAVSSQITQADSYTQLTNGKTRLSEVAYNSYGLVTQDNEYDYGVKTGAAPGNPHLIRDTSIAYVPVRNGIASMRETVIVYDFSGGTGVTLSSATYTYDGAAVTKTSGTPQHTTADGAYGNLTTIATATSVTKGGGTSLYRQFTYYDTGMLNNSTDFSTSSSSTCANNPSTCTTYNYSSTNNASCGNSFSTSVSEPMSLSVSMIWNCTGGVLTQTTDPNGNPTNYTYGDANYWRVTKTSFPDGGSTSTAYNFGTNSPWNITTSAAENSSTNVTGETVLDGLGRVVQTQATSDPSGHIDYVNIVYDSSGRIASVSNPYQTTSDPTYGITQYSYDPLNRTTAVIHPDNTQATFTYTGAAVQAVDEGNNQSGSTQVQRVYQSDGLGRLTSVCEVSSTNQLGSSSTPVACGQDIAATGFLTSHAYDALGDLTSVTQGSLSRSYSYDGLSRLTQEVNPESGTTTYTYDAVTAGNLYQRTRPKPNQTGTATVVTTYTFDAQHRLTGKSYNDSFTPSVTLSYDQSSVSGIGLSNYLGNLTHAAIGYGTPSTIFSYDKMNRVAENWQCTPLNCGTGNFSLTYGHDYLGDVTSLVNSEEGTTYTYSYDTLARLTELQSSLSDSNHPGTLATVNTYNPLGEVTQATLGNGIVRNMTYDNRGRLKSLADGSIYNFSLVYAPDSDIVTGNDSINGNWSYGYDDFNRISSSNQNSGAQTFSYVYDRYSNRWQQNAPQGGPAPQYAFNASNQIAGSGVVYDAAGNITNDGLGNTYTYDAENRVTSVSGNNSASYVYDALGQRVRATVNSVPYDFIYNEGRAVDEVTASSWVWGDAGALQLGAYANSTTYFNHSDWLGTVRAWSSVSGSSVGTCTNLPFGDDQTCTGSSPTPWHFTGLPQDAESGLTHALFRQLSTTQGRWTASDAAGLAAVDPTNPQSWNRYAYVANNPLNYVDPSGLKWCVLAPVWGCAWAGGDGFPDDPGGSFGSDGGSYEYGWPGDDGGQTSSMYSWADQDTGYTVTSVSVTAFDGSGFGGTVYFGGSGGYFGESGGGGGNNTQGIGLRLYGQPANCSSNNVSANLAYLQFTNVPPYPNGIQVTNVNVTTKGNVVSSFAGANLVFGSTQNPFMTTPNPPASGITTWAYGYLGGPGSLVWTANYKINGQKQPALKGTFNVTCQKQ